MKIIFFANYPQHYFDYFYNKNNIDAGYSEHQDILSNDYYGVFGSYTRYAKDNGHDAYLVVGNDERLQRKWALENNFTFPESNWDFLVVMEQIKSIRPDVLFISSMFKYFGSFLAEARNYCKVIIAWISCPVSANISLAHIDFVATSTAYFVNYFREKGMKSELITAAFDGNILSRTIGNESPDIPFAFIGSLTGYHSKRDYLLDKLLKKTDIQLFTGGVNKSFVERAKDVYRAEWPKNFQVYLPRLFYPPDIASRNNGVVWGMDMYNALRRTKIVFNAHVDIAGEYIGNMRMFEVTGCGSVLLTDTAKNMPELFTPDVEVVTYANVDEAIEKYNYLLRNEEMAKQIAKAGRAKTLKEHTMQNHVSKILKIAGELLS